MGWECKNDDRNQQAVQAEGEMYLEKIFVRGLPLGLEEEPQVETLVMDIKNLREVNILLHLNHPIPVYEPLKLENEIRWKFLELGLMYCSHFCTINLVIINSFLLKERL